MSDRLLKVVVSHLEADAVDEHLAYLETLCPGPILLCHGGTPERFAAVRWPRKRFLAHPGLRSPAATFQTYDEALEAAHEVLEADRRIDAIVVLEYDQVPLAPGLDEAVLALLEQTGAGLVGKTAVDRTATNWWHRVRYRDDPALLEHLRRVSVREDPTRIYGCLGTGFAMTREALAAYVAVEHPDGIYNELYVPTLVHHLGFRVEDVDVHGDLYAHVRFEPSYTPAEARALRDAGVLVVHPYKEPLAQLGDPAAAG